MSTVDAPQPLDGSPVTLSAAEDWLLWKNPTGPDYYSQGYAGYFTLRIDALSQAPSDNYWEGYEPGGEFVRTWHWPDPVPLVEISLYRRKPGIAVPQSEGDLYETPFVGYVVRLVLPDGVRTYATGGLTTHTADMPPGVEADLESTVYADQALYWIKVRSTDGAAHGGQLSWLSRDRNGRPVGNQAPPETLAIERGHYRDGTVVPSGSPSSYDPPDSSGSVGNGFRMRISVFTLDVTEQPLRLGQRNDGLGPRAHPRLLASASAPSSMQRPAAPRVGNRNRYR